MNNITRSTLCAVILVHGTAAASPAAPESTKANANLLWYAKPAAKWADALPIGNGHLGAMFFGGAEKERLQFNDNTLASDEPGYRTLPLDVRPDFSTVTNLIAQRQFAEADALVTRKWLGRSWACYQPLGDLEIEFPLPGPVSGYRRELDLSAAVGRVQFQAAGVTFRREVFASHADDVIVLHVTANQPGSISLRLKLSSPHSNSVVRVSAKGRQADLTGQAPGLALRRTLDWVEKKGDTWKYPELWNQDGTRRPQAAQTLYGTAISGRGTHFAAQVALLPKGGQFSATAEVLSVDHADEVLLLLSAGTSYQGFDKSPSHDGALAARKAQAAMHAAAGRDFAQLCTRHTNDFKGLFDRVALDLGEGSPQSQRPTDERIRAFANGQDEPLAALYFQYGRYLMIAGSRPGGQPLNLQGMWNEEVIPPWASGYTININTEMNYWPAEAANLSECAEPLWRMIRELSVDGARVAHAMYGRRGWVAHHNTTLWRDAQPVDNAATASFWPMGSGWLCEHLYEHYLFSNDRDFLAHQAYPLMKGAAEFYLDWLVPDREGRLVTPVGVSPENTFIYTDASGRKARSSVCAAPAMDLAIIRELFGNTLAAAETLGIDLAFREELRAKLAQVRPYQIGSKGQLLEWQEEFEEADPKHRHVSLLYGLHPGREITLAGTPTLATAARRTLELRGDGGTGWSKAWKISFAARLEEGDHAHRLLSELITKSTLPSLLDSCPPFQIDGNFGGCAGLAEMLLQSHTGEIHLLPALPAAWPNGKVRGLRARGGFTVDLAWQAGKVVSYRIASAKPTQVRVRVNGEMKTIQSERAKQP